MDGSSGGGASPVPSAPAPARRRRPPTSTQQDKSAEPAAAAVLSPADSVSAHSPGKDRSHSHSHHVDAGSALAEHQTEAVLLRVRVEELQGKVMDLEQKCRRHEQEAAKLQVSLHVPYLHADRRHGVQAGVPS